MKPLDQISVFLNMCQGVYPMANEEKRIWGIHTTDASLFMHDNVIAISWEDFGDCSKLEPNREAYKIHYMQT